MIALKLQSFNLISNFNVAPKDLQSDQVKLPIFNLISTYRL